MGRLNAWWGLFAAALLFAALTHTARAQEFSVNGFADFRLVAPSSQQSVYDGGLGKLRYGGGGTIVDFAQIIADLRADITPEFAALTTLRYDPNQKTALDVMEAYARYRPATDGDFHLTVKLGAFYPPISLENEGIGWSSPWTITSSAINSWVGQELRTLGGEATLEWRYDGGALEGFGSVFGWNDPAGVLIADRGWGLNDRPTGIFDNLRLPNAIAIQFRAKPPMYTPEFMEIDNQPGWYAGATLRANDYGRLTIMRYENRADPAMDRHEVYGWRTEFTSLGLETYLGPLTLLAQGMEGLTEIVPFAGFHNVTEFQSGYLLLGWDIGDWTVAGRGDLFATQNHHPGTGVLMSEHGHAATLSGTWRPERWVRLTAELMRVQGNRPQRAVVKLSPSSRETQFQLSARFIY